MQSYHECCIIYVAVFSYQHPALPTPGSISAFSPIPLLQAFRRAIQKEIDASVGSSLGRSSRVTDSRVRPANPRYSVTFRLRPTSIFARLLLRLLLLFRLLF
jgi:hypothetical protein